MSLNMFVYGTKQPLPASSMTSVPEDSLSSWDDGDHEAKTTILEYAARVQAGDHDTGLQPHPNFEQDSVREFLAKCTDNYINAGSSDPRRFLQQRNLFAQVSGTEGTRVHIEPAISEEDEGGYTGPTQGFHQHHPERYWVDVAVANSLPQVALENLCRLLFLHDLDVTRARLDIVSDGDNGSVTMLRMLVAPVMNGNGVDTTAPKPSPKDVFPLLALELRRVKWLDPKTMDLVFRKCPHLGVTRGEIVTALIAFMHAAFARSNPIVYSKQNIGDTVTSPRVIDHATAIADLFLDRFDPDSPLPTAEFEEQCATLSKKIRHDVEDSVTEDMLLKMIDVVRHTLKTNVYMPDRYALGLRLDPNVMSARANPSASAPPPVLPYGIVFVHGRRFDAFHVRFRDIARGGLRLVTPRSQEMYALESARQYDECYGLAYAQQLKNKDIPEGGSKAVALINTIELSESAKAFVMRKSVKAFTDTVLDLIVQTDETKDNIVDLLGKKEVLYLGPDEQVIPDDINWIIKRAAYRGYDTPAAFMSSKPRAGINHKEYGVTSEGVNVYLDVALRRTLGIDPSKDSFTVKITGGPDGDVAGNEMKILIREYGTNAKIVGVADASGCAEDPQGLNQDELMRLFRDGHSISYFDRSKLGIEGVLHSVDTPDGVKARNTMHNRLKADAFVPCGGRPGTIDITNYKQFLDPVTGKPSSPLIVEGANLFITSDARKALFEETGVVIVKDSSANKGGVITSSYEICGTCQVLCVRHLPCECFALTLCTKMPSRHVAGRGNVLPKQVHHCGRSARQAPWPRQARGGAVVP
jgi:glutamate dehydrogenase